MAKTKISWATDVWNPVTGCTKISEGCRNCYAECMAKRLAGRCGYPAAPDQFKVTIHLEKLKEPLHWKKPARIFVDSMGDLFHENIDLPFIAQVFAAMSIAKWHTFIVLTKRPKRMFEILGDLSFDKDIELWQEQMCFVEGWCPQDFDYPLPNVWLLTSIEDQPTADERIPWVLKTPAAMRGVSVEPMLGKINISPYLYGNIGRYYGDHPNYLNWVICGCESGPGARPMKMSWAADLKRQCVFNDIPFFFKQAKIDGKVVKMPVLDGKIWDEYPK